MMDVLKEHGMPITSRCDCGCGKVLHFVVGQGQVFVMPDRGQAIYRLTDAEQLEYFGAMAGISPGSVLMEDLILAMSSALNPVKH